MQRFDAAAVLAAVVFALSGCVFSVEEHSDPHENRRTPNRSPELRVEYPESVTVGEEVVVDASDSEDPDSRRLEYRFEVVGPSDEVVAERRSSRDATIAFEPEDAGRYVVEVVVTDGDGGRVTDKVAIDVENAPPEVEASWSLHDGDEVILQGTAETGFHAWGFPADRVEVEFDRIRDADGHETSIVWELTSAPASVDRSTFCAACRASGATLNLPVTGNYEARAVVFDEYGAETIFDVGVQRREE